MVDVWLPHGKTDVCVRIPAQNFLGTVEPANKPGTSDPEKEIERVLKEPLNSASLEAIVKAKHNVAVVVDDVTRPAPSHVILPSLIDELSKIGVKDENITIIFGCGTHRAVTREEAMKLLGRSIFYRVKAISHDYKAENQVYVGKTKTHGTKVYLNSIFAHADVKILTGDICFHYYAGYGGGRKSVLPAVTGEETIRHNHVMLLHPNAKTGVLEGNPVHQDMVEAAKLANVDFILNVVTNREGEIVKAFAGDLEKAFYEGVKLVDELYRVKVDRKADIVVVSAGGHPTDLNLFQAYKGVDNALKVVKQGGVIILVAECPEGHGNQVFYDWMVKFKNLDSIKKQIKRNFILGGHKAYYLTEALRKVKIILVSSLPDYYAQNVFRLKTARAVNDALNQAFSITGKKAKVLAMPFGNSTLPEIEKSES